jgi:NADPH:quinone reductase-like Zn-dependent oxidoreductase
MTESAETVFDHMEESVSGDKVSSPAMRAVRIHRFGGMEVIVNEGLPRPIPAQGQVLVRVKAAGVGQPDQDKAAQRGIRAVFFLVAVSSDGLARIAELLDSGQLRTNVGEVLPLSDPRLAHEMLAGRPHKPGKIMLAVQL